MTSKPLSALLLLSFNAFGNTDQWTGQVDNSFANPQNWFDQDAPPSEISRVPGAGDIALFGGSGGSVTFDGSKETQSLVVSNGLYDFNLQGNTYTLNDYARIGDGGSAVLTLSNGAISTGSVSIGENNGDLGVVVLTGTGSQLKASGSVVVGGDGQGTLNILNGGAANGTSLDVGFSSQGIPSIVTVDGAGSNWTGSDFLRVGSTGYGLLTVSNGGSVSDTAGSLGESAGWNGTATVDGNGSIWTNSDRLSVGFSGQGALTTSNGGVVNSLSGLIGGQSDGTGLVTVTDAGSVWNNSSFVTVGGDGQGTLNILNGGAANGTSLDVGYTTQGAPSTVTVDGAGSGWTGSDFLRIGNAGYGSLTVSNGGSVSNTLGSLGESAGGNGTATVDGNGSLWANSDRLSVGSVGDGVLTISNGGAVNSLSGLIGGQVDGTGVVTVTDAGSVWNNSSFVTVGGDGQGTLNILNGGAANGTSLDVGLNSQGAPSMVTVDGQGSNWTGSDFLRVGNTGYGTLAISNGGSVSDTIGSLGESAGGNGTATVDGNGSIWTNSDRLSVGSAGHGELTVSNGGVVTSTEGAIGGDDLSDGTVTITGTGSQWIANTPGGSGEVHVGDLGLGLLTLDAGGKLVANTVEIGANGTLNGDGGIIDGNVVNNGGNVEPGHSPGKLRFTGNYTQNAGNLQLEVLGNDPSQYDQLFIDGTGTFLGGLVTIDFTNDFLPKAGDMFNLIHAAIGLDFANFSGFSLIGLPTGVTYSTSFQGGEFIVSIADDQAFAVPAPSTFLLFGIGLLPLVTRFKRPSAKN